MRTKPRRKILFLTGTRADFGKLKPLMQKVRDDASMEMHIFVTGMHMLSKYGYTCEEVVRSGFTNVYRYINQNSSDGMDHVLAKTITGLSDFVHEVRPDLIIVHGDRVEALAGATVGALNNILTGHIEGGEVSGTVDELIRHAVTKLSHVHFVANDQARIRLIQLGESEEAIHVIGSPDIDVMNSDNLPSLDEVKAHYDINFDRYALVAFHPVTTEIDDLPRQIAVVVDKLIESGRNYVVIYPNNDRGTDVILREYQRLEGNPRFRIFPSMRFESFLTTLKNAECMIGNSSAGVREAPHFGIPTINLGSRQKHRVQCDTVLDVDIEATDMGNALSDLDGMRRNARAMFGTGNSADQFLAVINSASFWDAKMQKYFVDRIVK